MRRSTIEPIIGHLKNDNGMSKNWLKGTDGDMINTLLYGCGYNMRKLIRFFFVPILRWLKILLFPSFFNYEQNFMAFITV